MKKKLIYENLSLSDREIVNGLGIKDLYPGIPGRVKRIILVWNSDRRYGLYMMAFGVMTICLYMIGYTIVFARVVAIPYPILPILGISLIIFGLVRMYKGIIW